MNEKYFLEILQKLLKINSPIGYTNDVVSFVEDEIKNIGYEPIRIHSGGIYAKLGGDKDNTLFTSHLDEIGLMVRFVNPDGTLRCEKIGGLHPEYALLENVTVCTRDGKKYPGTVQKKYSSVHVTEDKVSDEKFDYATNLVVVLDMDIKRKEDVLSLGIDIGSFVCLEPRTRFENGYIKSRFIDDKVACAIQLALMKDIKDNNLKLSKNVIMHFAVFEELGHGLTYVPDGVKDVIAIDIAPTGPNQNSDEHKVSIFMQDSRFPYNFDLSNDLITCAKENGINYVVDSFTPHYGSDGDGAITAGNDIRHAAIGEGTANSHAYERTHMDGIINTYNLAKAYITK